MALITPVTLPDARESENSIGFFRPNPSWTISAVCRARSIGLDTIRSTLTSTDFMPLTESFVRFRPFGIRGRR